MHMESLPYMHLGFSTEGLPIVGLLEVCLQRHFAVLGLPMRPVEIIPRILIGSPKNEDCMLVSLVPRTRPGNKTACW